MENTGKPASVLTARAAGLVGCTRCGRVHDQGVAFCLRCGSALQSRDTLALQKVWAWWWAGLIAYIPANIYPMLRMTQFGRPHESSIMGGVIDLAQHGDLWVAFVVFFASIIIPIGKFIAIAYLAWSVKKGIRTRDVGRLHMYEIVEFIGRWSMIDVFVVAILTALLQMDFIVTVSPGIAAFSFTVSVVCTMISAQSFDPRTIWDTEKETPRV